MNSATTAQHHHIAHLNAFRGFAILNVIGAHAWTSLMFRVGGFEMADTMRELYALIQMLFHDSTIYFAVISGLLFSKVLRGRPWQTFYRNKLKNVIAPYVLLSVFFLTVLWDWYLGYASSNGLPTDYPGALLRGLLQGQTLPHFWYIPVLTILFVLTPALDAIAQRPRLRWLAALIAVAPLLISRTGIDQSVSIQSVVYFCGAYFVGMVMGQHYQPLLSLIAGNLNRLLLLIASSSMAIYALYASGYKATGLLSYSESLFYLQKLAITALVLYVFCRREAVLPRLLHSLGNYAFSIYFLHLVFVFLCARLLEAPIRDHQSSLLMLAGGALVMLVSAALTLGLSMLLKRLLRRHSRLVIGS